MSSEVKVSEDYTGDPPADAQGKPLQSMAVSAAKLPERRTVGEFCECGGRYVPMRVPVHTARATVYQVTGYRCPDCRTVVPRQ